MVTIYKYKIEKEVAIPSSARLLKIDWDANGDACAWAIVNTEDNKEITHHFHIFGTGWNLDEWMDNKDIDLAYLTTLIGENSLVWHFFEEIPAQKQSQILTPAGFMQI